jgi:hypothetical protein
LVQKVTHWGVLIFICSLVLVVFLSPSWQHNGINMQYRAKFLDMIDGKAYKPYVYRTLLPTTVRVVASVVPEQWSKASTDMVEGHLFLRNAFASLHWETSAAFLYLLASLLMLLCFIGFGHFLVLMIEQIYNIPKTRLARILLYTGVLVGLLPFFRYSSYIYDPPQLFLFTLALYYLNLHRSRSFFIVFVACCLNKETAALLIPVYGLTFRHHYASHRRYWYRVFALVFVYTAIKSGLIWYFHDNPGSLVEYQLNRNIDWLTSGWTFLNLASFFILATLVFFRWSQKPIFLRVSFLCVFPPLVVLGLFSGYLDEFRIYYEAYPLIFGLSIHSILHFRDSLG